MQLYYRPLATGRAEACAARKGRDFAVLSGIGGLGSYGQMLSLVFLDTTTLLTCSILTLVLAVLVCVVGMPRGKKHGASGGLRAFLNFDRLVVASIFKFCYVLLSIGVLVFSIGGFVHFCVEAISSGYASFLGAGQWALVVVSLLVGIVLCEVVLRVSFELAMLMAKLVENVASIKEHLDEGVAVAAPAAEAGTDAQGWYESGVGSGGYDGGYSATGYAQTGHAHPYPPEPVAVARSYAAPEPPAAWHDPSYGNAGYDQGAYGSYDPAYEDPGYDSTADYEEAGYNVDEQDASRTHVLDHATDATTTLSAGDGASDDDAQTWDCPCGARGNTGNFCSACGQPRAKGDA